MSAPLLGPLLPTIYRRGWGHLVLPLLRVPDQSMLGGARVAGWLGGWVAKGLYFYSYFYWRSKETDMEQRKGLAGLFLVISLLQGKSLLECLTTLGRLMGRSREQGGRVTGILTKLHLPP